MDRLTAFERFSKIVNTLIQKGATPFSNGATRAVLIRGDFVYKVPISEDGIGCNLNEAAIYRTRNKWIEDNFRPDLRPNVRLAKCRVIHMMGFPVLIMVKITIPPKEKFEKMALYRENFWIQNPAFDCRQVGLGKDGTLVAFDYSPPYDSDFSEFVDQDTLDELGFFRAKIL